MKHHQTLWRGLSILLSLVLCLSLLPATARAAGTTYTVSFDANGGTLTGDSTATTGADGKLTSLPTPTREGYTFDGWYTAETGGEEITTNYGFSADTTIYARWTGGDTPPVVTDYGFKINGQAVTSANINTFTTTGSITYDAEAKTLTLTDATIAGTALDENTNSILDCGDAVQTIYLVGENVITGSGSVTTPYRDYHYYYYGIGTEKSLTIKGSSRNDSLTITLPEWTCTDSTAYYSKVTRGISTGALTIQKCTLDVVCAGATNQSSDAYAVYANGKITIDNAKVNAVAGKNRNDTITQIRNSFAICADSTLKITDSDITAGAFSNGTTDNNFIALKGAVINLERCALNLTAEAPNNANVRALHATNRSGDVVTITDCEGTLHSDYYGIHLDASESGSIAPTAKLTFTRSILTITGKHGAVQTAGSRPEFNDVMVKAGADVSIAPEYSNPNSSSMNFWEFPYLSLTLDKEPPVLTAGEATRDGEAAATVKFTSSEAGAYYYAVVESGAAEPEIDTTGTGTSCSTAQQTISLTNLSGAGAKDIYIVVKDKNGNVSEKLKIVIPAYVAPIYSISATPAKLYFSSEKEGYTSATRQSLTITNTGNQRISLVQPAVDAVNNYNVYALSATWLAAGKTASVVIQPKSGLTAGQYKETLTISGSNGASASVSLFFVVTEADHSHDYGDDWKTDADIHWHECSSCGDRTDIAEHTASDWIIDQATTSNNDGSRHKECTVCGYVMETDTIPAGTTCAVTVNGSYATATGAGDYFMGETVQISAGTRSGYTFTGWTSDDVAITDASSADASFTMPGKAVTVTANWKSNSSSSSGSNTATYAITVESAKNGAVTVSPKNAAKGADVTLTVTPDTGYTLETLTVTDASGKAIELTNKGDGKYTFTMPAGKVTVKAAFMEDNSILNFFVDVPADAYYYDAVLWAAENGITDGIDETHFAPNATCTRAQIVTFLWRAAGCPEPESMSSFADVPADSYYAKAVAWAVEQGITVGTGGGKFAPDAPCTRAQCVAFLWRAQGTPDAAEGNPFIDVAEDTFYTDAVLWAAENGITLGTNADGTTFSPDGDCTRAQIVTFLYRCLG